MMKTKIHPEMAARASTFRRVGSVFHREIEDVRGLAEAKWFLSKTREYSTPNSLDSVARVIEIPTAFEPDKILPG